MLHGHMGLLGTVLDGVNSRLLEFKGERVSISFKPSLFWGFCYSQQNETLTSTWVFDPPHTFEYSRIKNEIGDGQLESGKCFREGREKVLCTPQGLSPLGLRRAARRR